MSKLALEEGVAAVLAQTRAQPPSLIPHLKRLEGLFIGTTPIVALTATRRLRIPEGKDAVTQAIDYLAAREPVAPVEYSWGMSEAARAKFTSTDSLTDRLKARGQWAGTCSDFVQLGVEDLDAQTIVCLMVISAGDPNRQIRERIFSGDKGVVGVAIGPYKQSVGVAVTLASKFVSNGPTQVEEARARGAAAHEAASATDAGVLQAATQDTMAAMKATARAKQDDYSMSDADVERQRQQNLASLDQQHGGRGALVAYDEGDEEMASIQRERMAKLAALERSNPSGASQPAGDAMPPGYGYVEHDAPARDIAYDPSIESYEEAEAKKRAFFEAQERAKREAMEKAEESRKNAWKTERAARELAKKKEEEERLRRLQEENRGFGGVRVGQRTAPTFNKAAAAPAPVSVPVNRAAAVPVNRAAPAAPVERDAKDDEMEALQRERMARIAALEQANAYARSGSANSDDNVDTYHGSSGVVSDAPQPDAFDPTRESFEEAEARKRAFFESQERAKREAMEKAEETRKNAWKVERAQREEAKKREEEERLRRLQEEGPYGVKKPNIGSGGSNSAVRRAGGATAPVASAAPVVRSAPVHEAEPQVSYRSTSSHATTSSHADDDDANKDPLAREEERLMKSMAKKTGGIAVFGAADPMALREEQRKKAEQERLEREARVAAMREEKWRQETLKAEQAAAARAAEAEAKARALASGQATPDMVVVAPSASYTSPPVAQAAAAAFANVSVPEAGRVEDSVAALENCGEEHPVRLYLNALIRPEESVELKSLSEIRDGVTYYAASGHKVHRASKYTVSVDTYTVPIPPHQLLNDDFNALSDYFFFATSPYLELYPDENRLADELMQVSNLAELPVGRRFYLASGNFVVLNGGDNPSFLLDGTTEIALPDEIVEALRGAGGGGEGGDYGEEVHGEVGGE